MSDLKEIKIFLASSIVEFENERNELHAYIARLNSEYHGRGINFKLETCENVNNALVLGGKQSEYDDIIRQSRYFYIVVGERIGRYTEGEFEVALNQFRETGTPLIYTYFKRLPEGCEPDQSVRAFMGRLGSEEQDGGTHYFSEFSSLDSIKLNIILELMRDPEVGGVVQFEDGRALLNGEEMVSLENIPIYSGNDNLQELREELEHVEARRIEVQQAIAEGAALGALDPMLATEFAELSTKREELSSQIHEMEVATLDNLNAMVSKSRSGEEMDPRERKAAELTNAGRYDEANAVLSNPEWAGEVETAAGIVDGLREKARQYVSGQEALIANLETMGITPASEPEIRAAYERASNAARAWRVELGVIRQFARFLRGQRCYDESERAARWIVDCAKIDDVPQAVVAGAYLQLADLALLKKSYESAERHNEEAIEILQEIAKDDRSQELELAHACVYLGEILWSEKKFDEANESILRGLAILERHPAEATVDLGYAYNMLGLIARAQGDLDHAESYMLDAIKYRAEAAKSGNQRRRNSLSISYSNMAGAYLRAKRYAEAEDYCRRCLEIRESLMAENPTAFQAKYALIQGRLTNILKSLGRYDEAEEAIDAALAIRRRLAELTPEVSTRSLGTALRLKAQLIIEAGWADRYPEAERYLDEAYRIGVDAYEATPHSYEIAFAETHHALGKLFAAQGRDAEARTMYDRAIELIESFHTRTADAELPLYSQLYHDYGVFLHDQGDDERARAALQVACEVRRGLYEAYPEIYRQEYEETQAALDSIAAT